MKKEYLCLGFLIFLITISSAVSAQSSVNIKRPFSDDDLKSVSRARFISLTNTALSIGTGLATTALFENNTIQKAGAILGAYGIIVAPATGNMYAEDYPRAIAGIGIRAIGAYLMADATSEIFGRTFADQLNVDNKKVSLTDAKILIGEVLVLGGFVYNVLSVGQSVKEFNARQGSFALNINSENVNNRVAPVLTARFNF